MTSFWVAVLDVINFVFGLMIITSDMWSTYDGAKEEEKIFFSILFQVFVILFSRIL